MTTDYSYLISGAVFGLSAGLSPGPLLTLVISETLKYNAAEGIKVALSPLLTDIPIILFIVLVLSRLSKVLPLLGAISICGGIFIAYLGWESLRFKGAEAALDSPPPRSIRKGVAANFLNPSPYLFWLSIGAPMLLKADALGGIVFVSVFYLLLVGSKVLIALAVGKSRSFLKSGFYVLAVRVLGIALFGFAVVFLRNGLRDLGLL